MNGVNRVILIGNLGKDPEIRSLDNGTKVAKFTMATNERYTTRNGEKMTKTEWHSVVLWRGLAENAERLLKKGSLVYIEGKLRANTYTDKDGVSKTTTEIEAENFTLLGPREGDNQNISGTKESSEHYSPEPNDGDLPF